MSRVIQGSAHSVLMAFLLAAPGTAAAEPVKCERTIAKASAKFAQTKAKELQSCEDKKAAGKLPANTVCLSEPKTAAKIQKAIDKLDKSISKDCGGKDKTCGTPDDDSLASIGWGSTTVCPNFENGACTGPIVDCDGIIECLTCVDEAAVDQAIALYYDELDSGQFGSNSTVNKCQRAIGKETTKFLQSKSKALQKCWDARLKGKHTNECPVPGDAKAETAIQKAEAKKVENICKACGGPDKACGGGDDLTPGQIGFADDCPDVTVPDASSCGGAIVDLQDVVDCVDCVTEFKVDCMDRLAVPHLTDYPPECNGVVSTTTTTSTSSTTSTTGPDLCGNGVVDPGEPCDPSSPGGVFLCAPGEVCSPACTCEAVTTTTSSITTSSSTSSSSTTTSTSTTTTTTPDLCGNGTVDPGEPCDPSSPGGVFLCAPGEVCSPACTCETVVTTTSTTSTTAPDLCGNGVVDPGEPCDPSSPGGAFLCAPGEVCSPACTCEAVSTTTTAAPTTTSSSTTPDTTTSTSSTTTTSTSTSSSSTTTTTAPPYGSASRAFLSEPGPLLD